MPFEDEALYLRKRLLRLHEMNRIVYPAKIWRKMEECLIQKTMPDEVERRLLEIMPETTTLEFSRELEFALADAHGLERYANEPERLRHETEKAAVNFRIAVMIDEIYSECGHEFKRTRQERIDDAAWWAVPEDQRGK